MQDKIRLGFHLSVAGSFSNAPKEAKQEGYTAFQIFSSTPRTWKAPALQPENAKEFAEINAKEDIIPFAHVPYLCNPSSTNASVQKKSTALLIDSIRRCDMLGIEGLVVHIGSHLGLGIDQGLTSAYDTFSKALASEGKVKILLENTAGYTNSVGSKFYEIGKIIDELSSKRLGVCFDTCHAFAAGYDLRTDEAVAKTVEEFDNAIGVHKIGLVHLNDAKFALGSGLDRHWHIGMGEIGHSGFVSLFQNHAFRKGSFVMETPGDRSLDFKNTSEIVAEAHGVLY
jgi:deoxyribonuclease-4